MNIANLVDTTELKKIKGLNAILLAGQAGNATGNIVADVVLGKSIPSGKLTDTWAASYEDYPSSKNFSHNNGDTNDEYYSDGIYVGYRYFDTFNVTPNYCFGYGKGYTDFETEVRDVEADAKNVTVTASVKNIGDTFAGKEVVQVYYSAPDGTIEKPYQELGGFGKSDLLSPGESQTITIPSRRDLWLPTMRKSSMGTRGRNVLHPCRQQLQNNESSSSPESQRDRCYGSGKESLPGR